jgi:broad specificity phosphatase PhoE
MELHLIRHTRTATEAGLCYGQTDVALPSDFDVNFQEVLSQLRQCCPEPHRIYSSPLFRCQSLSDFLSRSLLSYESARPSDPTTSGIVPGDSDMQITPDRLDAIEPHRGRTQKDADYLDNSRTSYGSIPLLLDDRLKELNFGEWENRPFNELPSKELNPWMEDFVNVAPPGGESYLELAHRVSAFVKDLEGSTSNEDKSHEFRGMSGPGGSASDETGSSPRIVIVTHGGVIRSLLHILMAVPLEKTFHMQIAPGQILSFTLPHAE